MKYRFHIFGMPHTDVTEDYTWCAYTTKVRHMVKLLRFRGHEVFVYAGEKYSKCIGPPGPTNQNPGVDYNPSLPLWNDMANAIVCDVLPNLNDGDFILMITSSQYPIFEKLCRMSNKKIIDVEYGVGYTFTRARFCVYESFSHMQGVLVDMNGGKMYSTDGKFYHYVAPNYYDTSYLNRNLVGSIPVSEYEKNMEHLKMITRGNPYVLFIGRLIQRKGVAIAIDAAFKFGIQIVVAGEGCDRQHFEEHAQKIGATAIFVGGVDPIFRQVLYVNAVCTFVPTLYLPPFEGVHAESLMCGTPVVTTPFGVFNETVVDGVNGFKCRDYGEFAGAIGECMKFGENQRNEISKNAMKRFSLYCREKGAVGEIFEDIWDRLYAFVMGMDFYTCPMRPPGSKINKDVENELKHEEQNVISESTHIHVNTEAKKEKIKGTKKTLKK